MPVNIYNREAAVNYAHEWYNKRNPKYFNFEKFGGDCTNFASQVLFAGAGKMNYTPVLGWYYISSYNRSPSWSGVQFFYNFLVSNESVGPFGTDTSIENVMPGDFIQLSFDGIKFSHTPVIVKTGAFPSVDNILVASHTYDTDYKLLSSYEYKKIRFINIMGVRV